MAQNRNRKYQLFEELTCPLFVKISRPTDTGFVEIPDDCSVDSAIRSYSAHRRWVDKYLGKVYSLMNLLDKQYDRRSEEKAEINLTKAKNQIAPLSQYTEFLKQKKYEKAKEHLDEVETLEAGIEKVWELLHKNSHQRRAVPASPAAASRPPPAADAGNQIKLLPELKPSVLPHDATAGELRIWIKKYEAYHAASGMQHTRTAVQHAYLLNWLDSTLSLLLDGSITAQTPLLGANSCISKLVEMFRKKYPLLLRRKNFFQMTQQAGQDARAFLEQLKSAASEADIEGMSLEDALCLTLLSGVRDVRLKEKLSELDPPTLPAFGVLIDAHLHSKATAGQAAAANRTEGKNQQQKKNNAPKITDAEKKRKVAEDVKCLLCNAQGRIQSACSQGEARSAEECPPSGTETLALEYQQQQPVEYANAQANIIRAATKQGNNSWPTPPMLL